MASAVQEEKLRALEGVLQRCDGLAVAFSGGVDSTFLLALANKVQNGHVIAITNKSPLVPEREHACSIALCESMGIRQLVIEASDLSSEAFTRNPLNRCYLCKRDLMGEVIRVARDEGFQVVAEGSNADDCQDFRPGFEAVRELGVISPLLDAGMTKQDIRDLSREMGLPTWNKQSFACLASRFPYGDAVTVEKLAMVSEAEQLLLDLGLDCARVRVHGDMARIEVPSDSFSTIVENRELIARRFTWLGFSYTALDLKGYRTGSMNEPLPVSSSCDRHLP